MNPPTNEILIMWAGAECSCSQDGPYCARCRYLQNYGDRWLENNEAIGVALLLAQIEKVLRSERRGVEVKK